MTLTIEILNDNALDLLKSLEKLHLIKFSNPVVKKVKTKKKQILTDTEFEAKVIASKTSKISYHFKDDQFNELVNSMVNEEPVDLEKYKIIEK
jgi:hypothetical protein